MTMQSAAYEHLAVRDDEHLYEDLFSQWLPWPDRGDLEGLKYPGVYVLAHTPDSLDQALFSWRDDIIYVGMTNALGKRLKQFDDTIIGKRATHGGADRVRYKHRDYENLCKHLSVAVAPFLCDDATSYTPSDLRQMGNVTRCEYVCFAHFVELFKMMPEFNDHKRSPHKYSRSIGKERLGNRTDSGAVENS